MRYIDLALAALGGTSAIAGIASMNPQAGDAAAHRLGVEIALRDKIVAVLQVQGVAEVLQDPGSFCSYIAGLSNSTFGIHAAFGRGSCGTMPGRGAVSSTLSVHLLPSEVTLVAWSLA